MLLTDAIDEYHIATLDLTPKTQAWYEQKLRIFSEWCSTQHSDMQLADVSPSTVRRFLDYLRTSPTLDAHRKQFREPPSTATLKGYAQVIKGFLTWTADEGLLTDRATAQRIKMPVVEQKVIEVFSPEQLKRLVDACRKEFTHSLVYRDRAMLYMLLGTGLRASELVSLKLSDLHQDERNVRGTYLRVMGKGRKEREIGLPNNTREHVGAYVRRYRHAPEGEDHLFLGRKLEPMTASGLFQWMERLGEWAQITGVRCSPHTLRHTFAVQYLLAGGDVYMLSRILGHSTVSTTEIYLKAMKQHQVRQTSFSALDKI
jgi:site-specific recombinase XerD